MAKKMLGLFLAIAVIVVCQICPLPEGLTREGLTAISIMIFALVLWICDTFPMPISALLAIALIPTFELMKMGEALKAFGSTSVFFLIATSAMTVILLKTTFPPRIVSGLIKWAKGSPRKFIFGFMVAACALSAIMSNTPVAMVFIGLSIPFLKAMDARPLESNMGKCLMIGIAAAAMIGGMATPCGTAINILAIDILGSQLGITITFLQWMVVGIPVAIIILLVAYFTLVLMFKPEQIPEKAVNALKAEVAGIDKISGYEKRTIVIIGAMFVLWIASSFFPAIDITVVAIGGAVAMFFPYKSSMLTWNEFKDAVPWNVVIIFGAVNVFAAPFLATGAADWVANAFVMATDGMSMIVLALAFSLFMVALNAVFPMGPAVVGLLCGPMAMVAAAGGIISPAVTTFICAFASGATFLLPISMVYLLTLDKGYYTWGDVAKHGSVVSVSMVAVCGLLVPILSGLIGL